ncbi:MAG TPA: dihydropteroate synthase [Anaeromyxobacteraceae bacterium]|nr:dihydropteroate synthase [Anaeromyxobacteraceae bacterium]
MIGTRLFDGPGPFVMGIVNATPDSFSDGGRFLDPGAAVDHALRLAEEGADAVDVGGESTRPGAPPVAAAEEIRRVVPVVERLRARGFPLPISVDTSKAEVARAALAAGADLVNDVRALADPELARVVAEAGAPVVLMHMRGTPADMAARAVYRDVVAEVRDELAAALARAEAAGVARERTILDPGLGFAKTAEHSLAILAGLAALKALGRPLLVGPSRKSFIGKVTGARVEARLPGTLAAVAVAVLAGAAWVRVHDVAAAREAARVAAAIRDAVPAAGPR